MGKLTLFFTGVSAVFILTLAYIYISGTGLESEAEAEAVKLASDLHSTPAEELSVNSISNSDEGSYAVEITNEKHDEVYQIAVILNEEQDGIDFAIDVTGTFDKYGLAYCH